MILFEIPVHNDRIYKITYYDGLLCTASSDLSVKLYKFWVHKLIMLKFKRVYNFS